MIAAVLAGCKRRIVITHGFEGLSKKNSILKRFFYRWVIEPMILLLATKVQCNSEFSRNQKMIRLFANQKSIIVYNFLEPFIVDKNYIWRKQNNILADDFLIVTIGNMHTGKGYDVVGKVIEHYEESGKVKFVVIGNGSLKAWFDKKYKRQIEEHKVYSLGQLSHKDAMQILSESNLFFLPTRFETLGMVFAEAGYYGIPCIGTKIGAVSEMVKEGKTGYLIDVDDYEGAIKKINDLLYNRDILKELGANAVLHINEMFSVDKSACMIENLYNS
jgi:glycosyltransferase involved in cell wall biosynthesis